MTNNLKLSKLLKSLTINDNQEDFIILDLNHVSTVSIWGEANRKCNNSVCNGGTNNECYEGYNKTCTNNRCGQDDSFKNDACTNNQAC